MSNIQLWSCTFEDSNEVLYRCYDPKTCRVGFASLTPEGAYENFENRTTFKRCYRSMLMSEGFNLVE